MIGTRQLPYGMRRGLLTAAPLDGARIVGVGAYRPRRVVTNDDLGQHLDTSDAWIRTRTGIETRRVAGDGESVVDMAAEAAAKALAAAGVAPADVDLVLVATSTLEFAMPQAAPQVAARLGSTAGGYDVGAACAGFCYALAAAADHVRAGAARCVVVAASERMTDILDPADRSTVPIFGDGAGAVVVTAADTGGNGIGPLVAESDGTRAGLIARSPDDAVLAMDGPAVFRWATTKLAPYARNACAAAGLRPRDLAGVVLHQANLRIVDAMVRSLDLNSEVVVARDVTAAGNTSAASIPLALDALLEQGELAAGSPLLLLGFGSGLTVAGQIVLCP